jgi:hypothetical protein
VQKIGSAPQRGLGVTSAARGALEASANTKPYKEFQIEFRQINDQLRKIVGHVESTDAWVSIRQIASGQVHAASVSTSRKCSVMYQPERKQWDH